MIGSDYYLGAAIDRRGGRINPLAYVRGLERAAIKAGAAQINPSCSRPSAAIASPWRLASFSGASSACNEGGAIASSSS
jgi:glycine/D-amino acid oxidase-like deaminating enzyme